MEFFMDTLLKPLLTELRDLTSFSSLPSYHETSKDDVYALLYGLIGQVFIEALRLLDDPQAAICILQDPHHYLANLYQVEDQVCFSDSYFCSCQSNHAGIDAIPCKHLMAVLLADSLLISLQNTIKTPQELSFIFTEHDGLFDS